MKSRNGMRFFAGLLSVVLFVSCGHKQRVGTNLFTAGSPVGPFIHFQYAVYLLPTHNRDPFEALRHILAIGPLRAKLVDKLPEEPAGLFVRARLEMNVAKNYVPPKFDVVARFGHGLTEEQNNRFQQSKEAFILDFAHPSRDVWDGLHGANQVIEELAREMNGLVWDEETRRIFTPDAWHEEALVRWKEAIPRVSDQTTIEMYENGEFVRAVTLGMNKFGLPDVAVQELDTSSETAVGNLINVFTQSLAEGAAIQKSGLFKLDLHAIRNSALREAQLKSLKENAAGMACVTPKLGVVEEGDAHNRLIQLTFEGYPGADTHAQLKAAIDSLFGSEDSIEYVEHTDELLEASRKAKAELPRLRDDFKAGLKPSEYLLVKAPFETPDGGREWMWVEVRAWNGNDIEGLLENMPDKIPTLHNGQLVKVRESEVFDYIRHFSDGRVEGNTTSKFLHGEESKEGASRKIVKRGFVPKCTD
ncbi:MAG TPA: DUF2314 domain-containing protein [Candidatus Acidoferrum sp.]|nr:DUF2314 domain-containing protein [Candidatus Acidoferrum sp.]